MEEEINVQDINWEDAPEGTTHYDTTEVDYHWVKLDVEGQKFYSPVDGVWVSFIGIGVTINEISNLIPKPEQPSEDSYTPPEADPFIASLKKKQAGVTEEISLADYLEAILQLLPEEEGEMYKGVSWYDYEKEELIGLPERGELVYSNTLNRDVTYYYSLHNMAIIEEGYYLTPIEDLLPLDYRGGKAYKARKEQHNLLESFIGDVDKNLVGCTYKGSAIELYNRGWRVSKEEVL